MSENVQFEMDQQEGKEHPHILYGKFEPGTKAPGMVKFLMKHGVKSEKFANLILVGLFLFSVCLTAFVYFGFAQGPQPQPLKAIHRGPIVPETSTPLPKSHL